MDYDERKAWTAAHVKMRHVNKHHVETLGQVSGTALVYTYYILPSQDVADAVVCKKFFLNCSR